jgi:hypothetical protein
VLALETAHRRQIEAKASNPLFSPAIFDPTRSSTAKRGRDNILYLQNLVLDFESGDLLPQEIPDLFPDLKLVVTNSYGHTNEAPRFRVIILTSATIGPSAYEALWDALANKLRDAGYAKSPRSRSKLKRSGLDYSKRAATSLFYLPAQAANGAESFFTFYNDDNRRLLDPKKWLMNVQLETPDEAERVAAGVPPENGVPAAEAIAKWRETPLGRGNEHFYFLAVELKKLGMTPGEIEQILMREASFGRSPAERRDQIRSIMRSLDKQKRAA